MSVAWFEVKRRPSEVQSKGASDGQTRGYLASVPLGGGGYGPVLPGGRRLPQPQPQRRALRNPQEALRFGGDDFGPLPATAGRGERALVPARSRPLLLAPIPRYSWARPFLVPPTGEEAAVLAGAPEALGAARVGG